MAARISILGESRVGPAWLAGAFDLPAADTASLSQAFGIVGEMPDGKAAKNL
jgi:hypothetical protein